MINRIIVFTLLLASHLFMHGQGFVYDANGNLTSKSIAGSSLSVQLNNLPTVWADDTSFSLTSGSPVGGSYTGIGIDNQGYFHPAIAGVGMHLISYVYDNGNACSGSASNFIQVLPPNPARTSEVSMLESPQLEVELYPNPADRYVVIKAKHLDTNTMQVSIQDLHGRVVYKESELPLEVKIPLSENFAEGIYSVQIKAGDVYSSQKLVIHH